ncbi:DUF2199 domain-containing protein [Kordia sp.]|uniref:DUF2199 domain-containing protein n=1 Tax=Kordia sp. TaxID=1965332 RepID=UPI003B59B371
MFWRKKKKKQKEHTCSKCGKVHEKWPALVFDSPNHYDPTATVKSTLTEDFCVIYHDTVTNYFIRVVLKQKIIDHDHFLEYGVWVSLSEKSFKNYYENFNNTNHETGYFGWFCNEFPGYESMLRIPVNVITKTGNERPEIFPHDDCEHQFVKDFYHGITKAEADNRIHAMYDALK